jgi:hypothetical protein
VIEPAQPDTVYVPSYNPSTVYGAPVAQPVGYSGTEVVAAGVVGFGAGMLLGALINEGYNNCGCNWNGGNVVYNNNVWASNSGLMAGRYPGRGYGPRPMPYGGRGRFAANNPNLTSKRE